MKPSVYNELSLRWALGDGGWTSVRVWRGLSDETVTSIDGKSHETVCLQWTFTQMSPGGWRLDEFTRVKEAVLWDHNFHGWKISWNFLFTVNFHSDEPWGKEVGRVYEGEGGLSYETKLPSHETFYLKWTFAQMSPGGRRLDECMRAKEGCLMRQNFHLMKPSM